MKQVQEGDVVILKSGVTKVLAVGRVVEHPDEGKHIGCGDQEWLRDFVGWDLPAYCYVEWYVPGEPIEGVKGLAQTAIARAKQPGPQKTADDALSTKRAPDGEPGRKLANPEELDLEEVRDHLAAEGLDRQSAENLVPKLHHLQNLVDHYYEFGYQNWDDVKEHEARTFLIVPLLLALGWTERQIKIELSPGKLVADTPTRKSIDVACFLNDYVPEDKQTNQKNCKFLIESKRFSSGVTIDAPQQVKEYANKLPDCETVLVSNGYCYKAFRRDEEGMFSDEPHAYLSLRKLTRNYPLDPDVKGALELLRLLLPQTWRPEAKEMA